VGTTNNPKNLHIVHLPYATTYHKQRPYKIAVRTNVARADRFSLWKPVTFPDGRGIVES